MAKSCLCSLWMPLKYILYTLSCVWFHERIEKYWYLAFTLQLGMEEQRSFCDDPLWDLNITWYTNNPDFTTCFHQTVLLYIPSIILFIFYPLSLWSSYKSPDRSIPWNLFNKLKLALNMVLIILPIVDFGYALGNKYEIF